MIPRKRRADEKARSVEVEEPGKKLFPFRGIHALFLSRGVSPKRLEIWKDKLRDLGGSVADPRDGLRRQKFTHVLAHDHKSLEQHKSSFSKNVVVLKLQWIEDCLKEGRVLPYDFYFLDEREANANNGAVEPALILNGPSDDDNVRQDIDQCESSSNPRPSEHGFERVQEGRLCSQKSSLGMCADGTLSAQVLKWERDANDAQHYVKEDISCNESPPDTSLMEADAGGEPSTMNKHITRFLREMWDIYESVLGDEWRALTYRKAAVRLENLPCRISSIEDVKHLSGVGSSMLEKIKEILCTGQLQKLEGLKADPKVQTLQHLASVWGVGPKLAQKLYQAGHRTVEDLAKEPSLSQMAQIGVKFYKDLTLRIPRDEVAAAENYVQEIGEGLCPGICIKVAGSYRRGNSSCGDIDFLVTHPDGYSHRGFLVKLVENLQNTGFVTEGLHCTNHTSEGTKKVDTFMGVGKVPMCHHYRRLDIKVYPKEAYVFALVYFTGNDILNRKIRYAAQRKGYKLNDQGLFPRYGGKKGFSSTESIACDTEEEVFSKVGFPYYEPCDRNV